MDPRALPYRGRIDVWDVTNETLNVFTPFFMERLGVGILPEIYAWVHAIDPGCQLVFNEWITEVFTGLPGPSAADVRDRVRGLLDTGVPIHMTEGNFVAPDAPEARAAQAEALMRVWWGHPAVDRIVFWGLWNEVNTRKHLHHGLRDDDGSLTRHGAAVVSLLNDRWRTRATQTADATGAVERRATLGEYVASWEESGRPVHVRFRVEQGPGTAVVAAVP